MRAHTHVQMHAHMCPLVQTWAHSIPTPNQITALVLRSLESSLSRNPNCSTLVHVEGIPNVAITQELDST